MATSERASALLVFLGFTSLAVNLILVLGVKGAHTLPSTAASNTLTFRPEALHSIAAQLSLRVCHTLLLISPGASVAAVWVSHRLGNSVRASQLSLLCSAAALGLAAAAGIDGAACWMLRYVFVGGAALAGTVCRGRYRHFWSCVARCGVELGLARWWHFRASPPPEQQRQRQRARQEAVARLAASCVALGGLFLLAAEACAEWPELREEQAALSSSPLGGPWSSKQLLLKLRPAEAGIAWLDASHLQLATRLLCPASRRAPLLRLITASARELHRDQQAAPFSELLGCGAPPNQAREQLLAVPTATSSLSWAASRQALVQMPRLPPTAVPAPLTEVLVFNSPRKGGARSAASPRSSRRSERKVRHAARTAADKENATGASAVVFCQGAATITPGGTPAPLPSTLPLARLLCRLLSKQPPLLHRQPTRVATRCGQLQAPTTPRLLKMGLGPGPCSCPLQRHCIVMPQKVRDA
jgi:hypothetical protein